MRPGGGLPSGQEGRNLLKPPQRPRRLGELPLPLPRRGARRLVRPRHFEEEGADVVEGAGGDAHWGALEVGGAPIGERRAEGKGVRSIVAESRDYRPRRREPARGGYRIHTGAPSELAGKRTRQDQARVEEGLGALILPDNRQETGRIGGLRTGFCRKINLDNNSLRKIGGARGTGR